MTTVEQLLAMEERELSAAVLKEEGWFVTSNIDIVPQHFGIFDSHDNGHGALYQTPKDAWTNCPSVLTPEWTFKLLDSLSSMMSFTQNYKLTVLSDGWREWEVRDEIPSHAFARAVAIASVLSRQEQAPTTKEKD